MKRILNIVINKIAYSRVGMLLVDFLNVTKERYRKACCLELYDD